MRSTISENEVPANRDVVTVVPVKDSVRSDVRRPEALTTVRSTAADNDIRVFSFKARHEQSEKQKFER